MVMCARERQALLMGEKVGQDEEPTEGRRRAKAGRFSAGSHSSISAEGDTPMERRRRGYI